MSAIFEPWDAPVPLESVDLPVFPVEALPSPFKEWCDQCAEAIQVPVDLPAMLNVGLVGSIGAKRFAVPLHNGHEEPLNVWPLVVLESGERKSSTFREAVAPLRSWEMARAESMRHPVAEYKSRCRALKAALKKAEEKAREPERKRLAQELADLEQRPVVPPRLIVDDVSPERLSDILAEQGGRILIASPEGGTFDLMSGRYSPNSMPNLDIYLKGYTGDDHVVDRVGREGKSVSRAHVSMALTTQPEVLRGLSARPSFRGRGVIGRFWYSMPKGRAGSQSANPTAIELSVNLERDSALCALLDLDIPKEPYALRLEGKAKKHHEGFHNVVQEMMQSGGRLEHMKDWGSRAAGGMARFAGILHLMEHAKNPRPWEVPISPDTALSAWTVMQEYIVPHAIAALDAMGRSKERHLAGEVVAWIKRHRKETFSRRDLHRHLGTKVEKASDWDAALDVLVEHGIVRELPREPGMGRPATASYEVNPAILGEGGQS